MTKNSHCPIPDCESCDTRENSVFVTLVAPELQNVTESKGCRSYAKGEMIFYVDQSPSGLFCVHRGNIKLYKVGKDGREQIIRLARPGDIIGYRAMISGERYSSFAVPLDDAQLCHIPKSLFFSLLSSNYNLSASVMTLLSAELKAAEEKVVEMAQKPVRERLAETLLLLKEAYGVEKDGHTLSMKLTRIEIANIVGTATESVSRLLSKLKEDGIIDMQGRRLKIMDHDRLVEEANIDD